VGLVLKDDKFCATQDVDTGNFIYPITGSLNLEEMVGTFLDLNQSGNLTAKDDSPPATSDNIQFITKLTGTLHPSIEISPVRRTIEIAKAGITATGIRQDKHSVIIVLTLPAASPSKKGFAVSQREIAAEHIARQRIIKNNSEIQDIARELRTMIPF
jgi:hypothetical protein